VVADRSRSQNAEGALLGGFSLQLAFCSGTSPGCRTKRCSEREPADSLRTKSNILGGWLPSLTFAFGDRRYVKKLTAKQWMAALLVSFLITGSLWSLAMTYFLYLQIPSEFSVHREDRWAIDQFHTIATNAFFGALTSGLILGICLPIAYKWSRKRRKEMMSGPNAEPAGAPNGGPTVLLGNSGVTEGPPSVT